MKSKKITLCGSTKFKREFEAINKQLTLEGNIVYSVAFFGHADNIPLTAEQKTLLDLVHYKKIDNSDGILVIDVDGYIGESTSNEIAYATSTGKFVKYLSSFPDLKMLCDATLFQPPTVSENKYLDEIPLVIWANIYNPLVPNSWDLYHTENGAVINSIGAKTHKYIHESLITQPPTEVELDQMACDYANQAKIPSCDYECSELENAFKAGYQSAQSQPPTPSDAMEFAEWCNKKGWFQVRDGIWSKHVGVAEFTTAELYAKFKKETK